MNFLDDVIKDYETYAALVKSLRLEIAELKRRIVEKKSSGANAIRFS